ncbi:MAG: hypothetical protein IKH88_16315, partial [Prevotella sp.]|nr:hypothetical protein [Prevotella sp.]
ATITVTDKESGQSVSFDVTVKDGTETGTGIHTDTTPEGLEAVDLGLPSGTLWANMNVGATKPEEYGGYYAWGETEEKDRSYDFTYSYYTYSYVKEGEYIDIGHDIAGTEYDVAHVKWGGSWRMPSLEQIKELKEYTTCFWGLINGVRGMRFIATNGNSIFLPAAGYRKGNLLDDGNGGDYWSSSQDPNGSCAYSLGFYQDRMYSDNDYRYYGQSVRPVSY